MGALLTRTSVGTLALLAAVGLVACNPFTSGAGGVGQPCSADDPCIGSLLCCEDQCEQACDADRDGFSVGKTDDPDCDDGNPAVNPEATEVCNRVDDDCDGFIDEEPEDLHLYDEDEDGFHICDCDQADSLIFPGSVERCNLADDDCDGETDEGLTPQDCQYSNEHGTCTGTESCDGGFWICDATVPAAETCDGLDNDCDGAVDEGCGGCTGNETRPCYSGPEGTQGVGQCAGGEQTCDGELWGACVGDVLPDPEICDDQDNDCDGQTDEDSVPLLEAETGAQAIDGLDNNCNGITDEPGGVMVEIQNLGGRRAWIDVYEATVFENPDCTGQRYGANIDDYPAEWPADGPNSVDLYACSLPGLVPSGSLSRWRAARACQAQGKRLCNKAEYVLACTNEGSVYPWGGAQMPPGICNSPWEDDGEAVETGAHPLCTTNEESPEEQTYDMIGNLAEWVSDNHPSPPAPDYPEMGLVAGWSYSLDVCYIFGQNCKELVDTDPAEVDLMTSLSNCVPGDRDVDGYPPTMARPDFGVRCCLDGP